MERRTGIGLREKEGKCSAEERASRLLKLAVISQYRAAVARMTCRQQGHSWRPKRWWLRPL